MMDIDGPLYLWVLHPQIQQTTHLKYFLKDGINSSLGDTEEGISDLEDRITEVTQSKQHKEKQI